METVDLRSDTVTKPSPGMRQAMADAEVGDDVFKEDPTVRRLQDKTAELLGTEDALYVPSGSMANQIAILVHCRPGDDVVLGRWGHSNLYEVGAGGAIGGVQFTVVGDTGLFTAAEAAAEIKPDNHHYAPTRLIMAENSHNRGGGLIFPLESLRELRGLADQHGIGFHIDGARLLNAAVASQTSPSVFGSIAHSLSLCLSKGLGAPVGSML
ncbi:MAG: aminotransferase class I/II-fold pyridoxal phosphate-dependent enzyme, partial [Myxococcales bacterium]|nr:aminotransferase class I/II-fold pyridoxal phosphate-dependent enzyme [Myxococcales bacterium]